MTEPKPYIELADFPSLTPFTAEAIRNYMHRGDLVEGVHYFRTPSHGEKRTSGRPIFKWSAICDWIEKRKVGPVVVGQAAGDGAPADIVPLKRFRGGRAEA